MSKNNKIIIAIVAVVVVLGGIFWATSMKQDSSKQIRVVVEQKADASFGESASKGCDAINETYGSEGYNCTVIEAGSNPTEAQLADAITTATNEADFVVGVGYKFEKAIEDAALANPEKSYVLIDGVATNPADDSAIPNVANVLFSANEASYMAGVVAATQAQEMGADTVGFIGGMEGPVIAGFQAGFGAGVASVDQEMANNMMVQYAGDFVSADKGQTIGTEMFNDGAGVIFHAAGGVGTGLFTAASNLNADATGSDIQGYVIGVDSAQCANAPGNGAEWCLTSALKNVDQAVMATFESYMNGTFSTDWAGQTISLGVKDGAVDLEVTPTMEANPALMEAYTTTKQGIIDGTIVAPGADAVDTASATATYTK